MPVSFPEIQVGAPVRHDSLSVFPLFAEIKSTVDYVLSDEAIAADSVVVGEVSEAGSVPDLLVENKGDIRVLFLEGEELVGAKQNRILNTTVLVAAHTKIRIPVSCVEQGRWRHNTAKFGSGGRHSPSRLRRCLKASVTRSLKKGQLHRSDQSDVWREVARQQGSLGAVSGTGAMSDTFFAYRERLDEFQENLQYVEGAIGVVVAVGDVVVGCDLFDKRVTCQKVWDRLLSGYVLDALELERNEKEVGIEAAKQTLTVLEGLPWETVEAVGDGEECRAESSRGDHGSTLSVDGVLVHGSVVCGP
jgi:ARG/rhodanese/phosphatase superfamily protein